jgi:hypothetical protein
MTISITMMWWYIPCLVALVGMFFIPQGPGGFAVACMFFTFALGLVTGHYLNF